MSEFCQWQWVDQTKGSARCAQCARVSRVKSLDSKRRCPSRPSKRSDRQQSQSLDCTHRGDPIRTVACQTCKNSTIDVTVYRCGIHGECTKHNYARSNPELAGLHVCRGCPEMQVLGNGGQPPPAVSVAPGDRLTAGPTGRADVAPGDNESTGASSLSPIREEATGTPSPPVLPRALTRAKNFAGAVLRDRIAGKPRRSPELVARLFNRFCKTCPAYNPTEGACADCGCPVNTTEREDNKLAWATEECPRKKWPIQTANLIFYLLPLEHPDRVWQWHVAQLRKRLHIFNGRRIITIATAGPGNRFTLASPDAVRREFGADADSIEFIERENDPQHWETPAFREMLRMLAYGPSYGGQPPSAVAVAEGDSESTGASSLFPDSQRPTPNASPSEATFYFHAKGVRRAIQDAIRPWCEAIYHHNLDRWNEVREILTVHPCCGIARQPRSPIHLDGVRGGGAWHFCGTGFWFNNAALFRRPHWSDIQDHSHAVEAYLGTQFPYESAYCLAHDNCGPVYSAGNWSNWRKPERTAVAPAGTWRDAPEDLTLLVLGHDHEKLHWATDLPHIQKVFLPGLLEEGNPGLDPRNVGESRIFHAPCHLVPVSPCPESYLGLCSQSWDRKYAGRCLPLAELDRLPRTPETVWAAHVAGPDWLDESERNHPGMRTVLFELADFLGVQEYRPYRPSLWATNLVAHKSVFPDLSAFHRRALQFILARWGWQPPYDVSRHQGHGGGGAGRELSFLVERVTTLYFMTRPDLEVKQIPPTL